jgi:hypothetical protein
MDDDIENVMTTKNGDSKATIMTAEMTVAGGEQRKYNRKLRKELGWCSYN